MRVIVPTCDSYAWCLKPFAYLFCTYWSELQPVLVAGNEEPEDLPDNFEFLHIGDYPAERWSDGIIKLLRSIDDDLIIWMLEDYWLRRGVNHQAVETLGEYARIHPNILRIDLTSDRLYAGGMYDVDTWGYLDILETPPSTPYQWSTQACIVNRKHFLSCLQPGIAPWDFELRGNELIPDGLRVLGTRQWPVRYVNGVGMGCKLKYNPVGIPPDHLDYMVKNGILPENEPL